jgi:DNA polymerase-3 subunit beta
MKFTIEQAALRELLSKVRPFISTRAPQPVLNNFLIGVKDGTLSVYGTDMECTMMTGTTLLAATDGRVTVPAKQLTDIVGKLQGGPIDITCEDGVETVVKQKRTTFKLRGMVAAEYPDPKVPQGEPVLELEASLLLDMITRTSYAIMGGENAGVLGGMWLRLQGGRLEACGTDGFRLSHYVSEFDADGEFTVIIPRRAASEVAKLLKGAQGAVKLFESRGELGIEVNGGEAFMTTRHLDGLYPPFWQVIPKESMQTVYLDRQSLIDAVDRVSIMTSELEADLITLNFAGGELTIKATRDATGSGSDVVNCAEVSEPFEVLMKAGYLLDSLKSNDSANVGFFFAGKGKPCLLVSDREGDPLTSLIMPFQQPNAPAQA